MKFTKSLLALAVATSAFGAQAAPAPNLIQNGSFESTVVTSPYTTLTSGLTGWNIVTGNVDLIGNYWAPSDGNQSLDLNGTTAGSISQTFATTSGQKYHISFDLAGNPDGGDPLKTLLVSISPQVFYSFNTTNQSKVNMGWTTNGFDYIATANTATLYFLSMQNSAYGPALDNVSVTAVPEPESYAMLLAGLGLMGAIARRRKQNQA